MPKGDLRKQTSEVISEIDRLNDRERSSIDAQDTTSTLEIDDSIFDHANEADLLSLDGVEPPTPPNHRQWISLSIFILMSISMIMTGLVATVSSEKKTSTLAAEQTRLAQSVEGRKKLLKAWIDSRLLASRRLTESDLVRLFVSDMALNPVSSPLPRALLDQRPYFQTLISDFVEQNDLTRAAIIDDEGRLLLSSPGAALDIPDILSRIREQPIGWQTIITSIRPIERNQQQHVIDILVPVPKPQIDALDSAEITAILAMTVSINRILNEVLAVSPSKAETEALYLIHQKQDHPEQIGLGGAGPDLIKMVPNSKFAPGEKLEFGRFANANSQIYYALGEPMSGPQWTIIHTIDSRAALGPVNQFIIISTGIGIIFVFIFGITVAALWWHRTSSHHHELISLYQSLTKHLNRQSRLLSTITGSISDWLAVTNERKQYIYANPAFCSALNLSIDQILGRHQSDLPCSKAFTPTGDKFDDVIEGEQFSTININKQCHFVTTTESDLKNDQGRPIGTVMVTRNETELVHQRQKCSRALKQTIDALVQTIECRDPFLHGHTSRLRTYTIALGRTLGLGPSELSGLALAASLSQIGKVFIPDDILTKSERHDRKETEIMRTHIYHAINILGRIDFGYPVLGFLEQMHERLDGSGYPKGLVGINISMGGRILAVADVFCARTEPRSYRHRLSAGKALYYLADNNDRYDIKIVAALAKVITEKGEIDSTQGLDANFLDSQAWIKAHYHSEVAEGVLCR